MIAIRTVEPADLSTVQRIYDYYVLRSTCTFATQPTDAAYWRSWSSEHDADHPAIVAVQNGEVVGWATLSRWNLRCAYRFSVEDSVYVRHDLHGRGIGRQLLAELIRLARQCGHRNIVAQIAGDQPASERLHDRLGFKQVGCLSQIGYKFDRWIDVGLWQLKLPPS